MFSKSNRKMSVRKLRDTKKCQLYDARVSTCKLYEIWTERLRLRLRGRTVVRSVCPPWRPTDDCLFAAERDLQDVRTQTEE